MNNFSVRMINKLSFSECSDPGVPLYYGDEEVIVVTLKDDLLTIADTGIFEAAYNFAENYKIYAKYVSSLNGVDKFEMLEFLPVGIKDIRHFSVLKKNPSMVEVSKLKNGKRHLHAFGTDDSGGRVSCRGWVFDALES
jgi:hypothetical protein